MRPVYVALLHYPIQDRSGATVATSVTNLDLHDIARSCRTYGVERYFVVTPVEAQHAVVGRILGHWHGDQAREWHPKRGEALSRVELVHAFQDVQKRIEELSGERAEVILTDARPDEHTITYQVLREEIASESETRPVLVILGTGWGVAPEFFDQVGRRLDPIWGPPRAEGYNHLSVRAAAAVILDRLMGA